MTKTSIVIQKTTKERLSKHGNLDSTFDSVVKELLDHVDECDSYWTDRL